MKRREVITLLGGAAVAWPLAAHAQQAGRLPTIGVLGCATPSAESQRVAALVQRLQDLGWIEGRNIAIEYRWAEGRSARLAEIAAELVRLRVDVIFATGTAPALAAKQATSVIPIVFPFAGDPIGSGLVTSLARPGGNITGMSNQATDLAAKRIELLREIVPHLHRLAVLANAGYPAAALEKSEVEAAARTLGLEVVPFEVRESNNIAPAFEAVKGKAEALFLVGDPLMTANRTSSYQLGTRGSPADHLCAQRVCRRRRSHVIRSKFSGPVPPLRRSGGQDFTWDKTWRYSGRAAD